MPANFSKNVTFDGKILRATLVPEFRKDGTYYEVNIKSYPRFYMSWSPLGRYDMVPNPDIKIPYPLVLAVSDAIEEERGKEGIIK